MYSNVKVGDEFIVSNRNSKGLYKVKHITKTRFTVGGGTFLKKDGAEYGSSRWENKHCFVPTEKEKIEFLIKIKKNNLAKKINNFDFNKLDIETLEKIHNIIGEEL